MILLVRTDKPDAELYLYEAGNQKDSLKWLAHRELSDTLLLKIAELLKRNNVTKTDITGIAVYKGPGSFTGLRIGLTVANTFAYTNNIPIAAATGEGWIEDALKQLHNQHKYQEPAVPLYGSEARITQPKK